MMSYRRQGLYSSRLSSGNRLFLQFQNPVLDLHASSLPRVLSIPVGLHTQWIEPENLSQLFCEHPNMCYIKTVNGSGAPLECEMPYRFEWFFFFFFNQIIFFLKKRRRRYFTFSKMFMYNKEYVNMLHSQQEWHSCAEAQQHRKWTIRKDTDALVTRADCRLAGDKSARVLGDPGGVALLVALLLLRLWFADTVLWLCRSLPTETLKWLSSLPILMQKSFRWWQCSDSYLTSLPLPHLHTPSPHPFSPSLISRRFLWTLSTMFTYFAGSPHSSGAVWETSRWPSWAVRPNEPSGFRGRVKLYWTMLRHWSQLVPNMSTDIWGH